MHRTLLPIVLIVLVLLGAWLIWPQPEPRGPLAPTLAAATETLPARASAADARVETPAPATQRAAQGPAGAGSVAAKTARLDVHCVARTDGRPLGGVRVYAQYADARAGFGTVGSGRSSLGKPGDELLTDAAGQAAFELESGRALSVTANDREHFVSEEGSDLAALSAGESRELRFVHDAGEHAHFCGLVVAHVDGKPIANAEIRVNGTPRTSSDGAGRFELDFAAHLAPWLQIEHEGFGAGVVSAEPGHESADRARRVDLDRCAALRIALQVPAGQAAVRVGLRGEGGDLYHDGAFTSAFRSLPPLEWTADADAQGQVRFEELPPGVRLNAEVVASTGVLFRTAQPIVLQPGESRQVEWDLRGTELVGHVYEADGKPAPGIELGLLRGGRGSRAYDFSGQSNKLLGRTSSAEDGSYRFAGLSPGTWILAAQAPAIARGSAPADAIAPVPLEITIDAGELRSVLDVHLARGLFVRGTLVAPDGTTGVQGYVFAHSETGTHAHTNSDEKGGFVLGPLADETFRVTGAPYNSFLASAPVMVRSGGPEIVLRARPGAEVAGVVLDWESGAGTLAAVTVGGEGGSMTTLRTQPDGTFRLDGLAPGRYALFASTGAGLAGELPGVVLDPVAPVEGLQVVLKPGAKVRVRHEGWGIGQASVRRNGLAIGGDGIEAGRSWTQVVPPGRVDVVFHYPDVEQTETQELELDAGEEREVVFRHPPEK